MQTIILVAGRGTRMNHLTDNIPKPMLIIDGKPLLEYKLDSLPQEINEVVLVVGYKKEVIKNYFGDIYKGLKITYVEQQQLNGTAGAIQSAKSYLKDTFLVLMGDDLYHKEDLDRLLKYKFSILTHETKEASQFGIVEVDSKGNPISIMEKPHNKTEGLVNVGAYTISQSYFKQDMVKISETEFGLPQTLISMKDMHDIKIIKTNSWQPIGSLLELKKAKEVIRDFYC